MLLTCAFVFSSLTMIMKLPGSGNYNSFAYSIDLLKEFVRSDDDRHGHLTRSAHRHQRLGGSFRASFRGASLFGKKKEADLDSSIHSAGSLRGRSRSNQPGRPVGPVVNTSSVHGSGNLFKEWNSGGMKNPRHGMKADTNLSQ